MKQYIRLFAALFALLVALAWHFAGVRERAAAPEEGAADPIRTTSPLRAERDSAVTLRVLHGGSVEEMTMDAYLLGVLRAEMPASFELEALKAQAVAARTYTYYKMSGGAIASHPEADACDDITCCKAYMSAQDAAAQWGSMALYYEEKLARAVAETDGEVILYDGAPVLAVFFSSAAGHTQGAGDVWQSDLPYLQAVESAETEELVPNYYSTRSFTPEEFRAAVQAVYPQADFGGGPGAYLTQIERNDAGYVASVCVGGVTMKGNDLRTLLGLRSPCFTVEVSDEALTFHVTGYGHGVGMSQYGANAMAKEGATSTQILEHYFTGATVEKITQETPLQ